MAIESFNYTRKDPNEYDSVKTAKAEKDKYSTYTKSDSVVDKYNISQEADTALKTHANSWNNELMSKDYLEAYDAWQNRADFSYDVNGDALYQQYKDQYINQGRLAMMDTMGQAAAMTGGYGNSYAATVGNQAYQGYLQKLNEVVPELYNMAYNMYQQEGEDLRYAYESKKDEYKTKYGEWADKLGFLQSEANRADSNYYNEANLDWTMFNDNRTNTTDAFNTALEWATNNENTLYSDAATKYQLEVEKQQLEAQQEANRISAAAKKGGLTKAMTAAEIADQLQGYKDNEDNVGLAAFLDILEQDGIISSDARKDYWAGYRTVTIPKNSNLGKPR